MAPQKIAITAKNNQVAQLAAASSNSDLPVDPLLVGAAWRTYLAARAFSDPAGFVEKQFKGKADGAHKALALRCGLFNLQVAALQVAACQADMKTQTKRNLHAAMALNNFSSAALAQYNAANNNLSSQEAQVRSIVTIGLGAYAAFAAIRENNDC